MATKMNKLNKIISVNDNFSTAINLYLSLNNTEKIKNYIPSNSSVQVLMSYLDAIDNNKEQATLLVGPYGKGKSHLMLVLLGLISLERNDKNSLLINELKSKISSIEGIGDRTNDLIDDIWAKGRFLPVIINFAQDDLEQSFLIALNDALKRDGLDELIPDTYYSSALDAIEVWEKDYPSTVEVFESLLKKNKTNLTEFKKRIKGFDKEALDLFMKLYPQLTSGSIFRPLSNSEAIALYKSISEKIVHDYGYRGIYIVFDEFSKFIESQDGESTGKNMKLVQDICELSSDINNAELHITLIAHKSIKEYGDYLSNSIINSFTGIEGRITEKYFISSSKNNYELIQNAIIKSKDFKKAIGATNAEKYLGSAAKKRYYKDLPIFKSIFNEKDFEETVLNGCYPLNPVSAYILFEVSEKVAQNERTLFTFISKNEQNSMIGYIQNHPEEWIINADVVYDYFCNVFKKDITNSHIHNEWLNAEYALGKVKEPDEKRIIKALALINIVNNQDELPSDENSIKLATNINESETILKGLQEKELLYKKESNGTYHFKTRAGVELIKAIKDIVNTNIDLNVSELLKGVSGINYILPNKYNLDNKITRYFDHEYMNVEDLLSLNSGDVLFDSDSRSDGKIVSLYSLNKKDYSLEIRNWLRKNGVSNLILEYSKKELKCIDKLKEYYAIDSLKNNPLFISENEIQVNELLLLEDDIREQLKKELFEMFESDECIVFVKTGKNVKQKQKEDLSRIADDVFEKLFSKTPIINNELVNKNVINTSVTKKTRNKIIENVLKGDVTTDYYEASNQEASVFRAVYCVTGLVGDKKITTNMENVVEVIDKFVSRSCDNKLVLNELIELLSKPPIGLKRGVIPFYVAFVLARRTEDIVIYFHSVEKTLDADTLIDMCERPEEYWLFISKESASKEKYISDLQKLFWIDKEKFTKETRISGLFGEIQKWYRGLPQTTRLVKNFEKYSKAKDLTEELKQFMKGIQQIDANPYEKLFIELPNIFGSKGDYEKTFSFIKKCKKSLDGYFEWLTNRVIKETVVIFGGKKTDDLYHTVKEWYEKQSDISKQGLYGSQITNLMTCIQETKTYDDVDLLKRIVKATTDVYLDTWNENSYQEYLDDLIQVKEDIESIKDEDNELGCKLSFIGKDDEMIERYYERIDDEKGYLLKSVLEGTLEDFEDMSVNDRVAILLEIIEDLL